MKKALGKLAVLSLLTGSLVGCSGPAYKLSGWSPKAEVRVNGVRAPLNVGEHNSGEGKELAYTPSEKPAITYSLDGWTANVEGARFGDVIMRGPDVYDFD